MLLELRKACKITRLRLVFRALFLTLATFPRVWIRPSKHGNHRVIGISPVLFREKAELNLISNVLLRNYSKQVLPIVKSNEPVKVTIQLILRRLVQVNEKSQYISIYTGVMIKWNNPTLRWNPKEHTNIEHVHLQNDRVWVPDICLYNTLDESGNLAAKIDTAIKIHFSGNTTWLAPIQFKSECKIDVNFFPFDHQVCDLKFGSWTYEGKYIDIDPLSQRLNFSQLVENPAWQIVEVIIMKRIGYYPQPYPYLVYRFVMKRRILYYLANLVIPCVMISFLAFLSFCLPVQSGERIALVITMLLSMTVYMMLIFDFMPPNSEVIPLVSKFYLACIIEIALCLVATFLTIKWYYNEKPMPKWIHIVVNKYLASALLFKKLQSRTSSGYLNCRSVKQDRWAMKEGDVISNDGMHMSSYLEENDSVFTKSAKRSLAVISDKIQQDEQVNDLRKRWEHASKVVDRFFFLLFLALFLMTVVLILHSATASEGDTHRRTLVESL